MLTTSYPTTKISSRRRSSYSSSSGSNSSIRQRYLSIFITVYLRNKPVKIGNHVYFESITIMFITRYFIEKLP